MHIALRTVTLGLVLLASGCLDGGHLSSRENDGTSVASFRASDVERITEARAQQILSDTNDLRRWATPELMDAFGRIVSSTEPPETSQYIGTEPVLGTSGGEDPRIGFVGVAEPVEPIKTGTGFLAPGDNLDDYDFVALATAFGWQPYMSESQIQNVISQGYRVHDVEVVNASPLRFSVIFVKNSGPYQRDSIWKHDTTSTVLLDLVNKQDYRVTKLKPRQVGTARRFSAVLEKNTGSNHKDWVWYWDTGWDAMIDAFDEQGFRPIDVESYQVDGRTRYAGVAVKNTGGDYRPWSTVEGISSTSVEALAKLIWFRRYTDLTVVNSKYYGIFTGSSLTGIIEHGLNHWTHNGVPQSKVTHLIKRHGSRIINIQRTFNVDGDQGPEKGYVVTLVENGTPKTGLAKQGFSGIDNAMIRAMKRSGAPGGGLAIAKNGKLIYARGYGYADIEEDVLATPETVFRLGSVSKTMTGLSAMRLVQDGVPTLHGNPLTLDTQIFTEVIFPYFEGEPYSPSNISLDISYPHLSPITLRHVLTHTAGWFEQQEDYGLGLTGFGDYMPLNNTVQIARDLGIQYTPDCQEIVPYYFSRPLDANPGEYMFYSGLGVCVTALVVEILAQKHYGQHFISDFINSLKINSGKTRFTYSTDYYSKKKSTEARFYHDFGTSKWTPLLIEMADHFLPDGSPVFTELVDPPYGTMPMRSIWSAGGWAASPVAMMRLGTALERTRRPYASLDFASYKTAFEVYNASKGGSRGMIGFNTNGNSIWHGGALTGGLAWFQIYGPDQGQKSNLMFTLFYNATPGKNYNPSINSVISAIYSSMSAINSADWDLFPMYGFEEPDPAPLTGTFEGSGTLKSPDSTTYTPLDSRITQDLQQEPYYQEPSQELYLQQDFLYTEPTRK